MNAGFDLIDLMNALDLLPTMQDIHEMTKDLDSVRFLAVIGTVIDLWVEHNKLSKEETQMLMKTLLKAQQEIHEAEGVYPN